MFSCAADVLVCVAPCIWFMCRWRIFECILCRVYPNFRSCESQKNSVLFQKSVECIQIVFFNYKAFIDGNQWKVPWTWKSCTEHV